MNVTGNDNLNEYTIYLIKSNFINFEMYIFKLVFNFQLLST